MAEENARKRTREEDEQEDVRDAKRSPAGPVDAGLMAFLDRIDSIDKNEEEQSAAVKSPEADGTNMKESLSVENNNNDLNFNDVFIDVAEELEMSYFHFCDEDGGLMAVYSTHHGFVPDYAEVNDLSHEGTLWEDDIWQLNDEIFRYT